MLNRIIMASLLAGTIIWTGCQSEKNPTSGVQNASANANKALKPTPIKISQTATNSLLPAEKKGDSNIRERTLQTVTLDLEQTENRFQVGGPSEPVSPKINKRKRGKVRPGPANRKRASRKKSSAPDIRTSGPVAAVRINAELLLRPSDIDEILGVKKGLDVYPLSGIKGSSEYDGLYWGNKKGANYIAGIQVWRPHSPIEAQRQYNDMVRSYPNVQESTAITNKTFLAHWNEFIYLAYMVPGKRTVVSLTCHVKACKSPTMLVRLGERIKERL